MFILATKSSMPILGQVAHILGWLMDGIFKVLDGLFGIENIGLCIIIITLIVYLLMTPLQIKQQKFSKMSAVMNPELQAIQKKYKDRRDQASIQKMQEETTMVYQKYGVSPTGSCLQLLIQMPILLSLYQVIYRVPAYVGSVKNIFTDVVDKIVNVNGYTDIIQKFLEDEKINQVSLVLDNGTATRESVIDVLYKLSPSQWQEFADISKFSTFSGTIDQTAQKLSKMQYFLGLNIADAPLSIIKDALTAGSILLAVGAVMVPLLAWFTQWLNYRLMPQASMENDENNNMANTMKTMNNFMPVFSAVMCFTFQVGIGLYWVAGAVIRSLQMLLINHHISKVDMDELIKKNMEKAAKKREKAGLPPNKITSQAHQNVRNINRNTESLANKKVNLPQNNSQPTPGSIADRANLVKQFEEKNKRKNR